MLLKRLLLTKEVEVYELKKSLYTDVLFYMIFFDCKRPSCFDDFSHIKGFYKEDFCERENFIQAIILYNNKISDEAKNDVYEIASGFLEDKDDCDWSLKYISCDLKELRPISTNHKLLIENINKLLKNVNASYDNIKIDEKYFKYLIQQ